MKGMNIGELEELVLLIIASDNNEAYGVHILQRLSKEANRTINISAVHAVLKRLEAKGMVKSTMGSPTAERGGRRKRLFSITKQGANALEYSNEIRSRLYNQVAKFSFTVS